MNVNAYSHFFPGDILREIRINKDVKPVNLCLNLISTSYYSKIETNQSIPSLSVFLSLLYRLNISTAEFLYISREYTVSNKEKIFYSLATFEYQTPNDLISIKDECRRNYKYSNEPFFYSCYQLSLYLLGDTSAFKEVNSYLINIDKWYLADFITFSLVCSEYDETYIDIQCDLICKKIKRYIQFPESETLFPMIFYRLSIGLIKTKNKGLFQFHVTNFLKILSDLKLLDSKIIYGFLLNLAHFFKDDKHNNKKIIENLTFLESIGAHNLKVVFENDLKKLNII